MQLFHAGPVSRSAPRTPTHRDDVRRTPTATPAPRTARISTSASAVSSAAGSGGSSQVPAAARAGAGLARRDWGPMKYRGLPRSTRRIRRVTSKSSPRRRSSGGWRWIQRSSDCTVDCTIDCTVDRTALRRHRRSTVSAPAVTCPAAPMTASVGRVGARITTPRGHRRTALPCRKMGPGPRF